MLSLEQATELQSEAEALLEGRTFEIDSHAVLELVQASDCTAFDCEFVALAIQLADPLVTMDKQLLQAFPKLAVSLSLA